MYTDYEQANTSYPSASLVSIQNGAQRESQVSSELSKSNIVAEKLHQIIANLEDRLNPVLRPQSPNASGELEKDPELLVGVAKELRRQNQTIGYAISKLQDIASRLEI